jgi:hypothetical protein
MSKHRKPKIYELLSELRIPEPLRRIGARLRLRSVGLRRTSKTKGPTRVKQM